MTELVIRQIEFAPGDVPRELRLAGWAAPMDEIDDAVEQRSQQEWVPAARAASTRLDGPEEMPIELKFTWKTRLLAPGDAKFGEVDAAQPVARASDLVALVKEMVRTSSLVMLFWGSEIVIVGFLQRFEPHRGMHEEYEPTLTLQPSESPALSTRALTGGATRPRSLLEDMERGFEAAISTAERTVTHVRQVVDDAAQAVANVREGLSRMRAVVDTAGLAARDATAVRRGVGEQLQGLTGSTGDGLDTLSAPYSAIAQSDEPEAQMRARRWRDTHAGALRAVRARAALERARYRPESDILGFHEGTEGETIWLVSWIWYGDTGGADDIRRRNGMVSTRVRAGQRLVIPLRGAA